MSRAAWNAENIENAVIANTETASSAVIVGDKTHGSFEFPAELTGTGLTIEGQAYPTGAWDVVTFQHPDTGADVNLPAITKEDGKPRSLHPCVFRYYAIRFVSSGAEGAARTIPVFLADK